MPIPPDLLAESQEQPQRTALVKDAWKKIVDRSGGKVRSDGLEEATWGFADFALGRLYSIFVSMAMARGLGGWKGWGSGWGAYKETFDELVEKGVVSKPGAVGSAWGILGACARSILCSQNCYIVYEVPPQPQAAMPMLRVISCDPKEYQKVDRNATLTPDENDSSDASKTLASIEYQWNKRIYHKI